MGQSGDQTFSTWTVVSRFRHIASEFSQRTAVVCLDERLSYAQLNERANRFAHHLINLGVKPEEPVGLAIPKSCTQIAAVLGVLKAGGAYVPLVDHQPLARLRTILDDVGCRFILTHDGYLDELSSEHHQCVTIESCRECSTKDPDREIRSDQLAYILSTSGSTGTPKGVMIEHAGVVRLVCGQDYLPFGPDFHYLFAAPMSFDVSTLEIFSPLLHGAKLAIVPEGDLDPSAIRDLCHSEGLQSTCMAFGLFSSLFDACPAIFEQMPVVAVGGEQVLPSTIARAQRQLPNTRFINAYGPTEATMLALTHDIPSPLEDETESIPIGKPLHRMQAFVLDAKFDEVARGETGELCLAGVGLARGYWNRPEQTRAQFVERTLSDGSSQRIYRTGDLAKLDEDGNIVCLGRIDDQVKVRGYRIELGEIESQAAADESVVSAAATIFGTGTDQSLGLAIVPSLDGFNEAALYAGLADVLPGYMMPAAIRRVESIPLSPNGKVDRAALTVLFDADEPSSIADRIGKPLGSPTEEALAKVFGVVLDVSSVLADDQFLHLGGHSLRAVVLSSRVRDRFGVALPISKIYQLGSLRAMAQWIDEQMTLPCDAGSSDELTLRRVEQGGRSLLSFNQQRLWMLHELQPDDQSYLIRIELKHEGKLNRSCFDDAWDQICIRHAMLRARIEMVDAQPWQVIDDQHPSSVRWHDCEGDSLETIRRNMIHESSVPFELGVSPLIRCAVYEQRAEASVLITMHHIISDAWSCEVLQRELSEVYSSLVAGGASTLEELPIEYTDFAYWQRQLPETSRYKVDLDYWTGRLSGVDSIELPTDYPRGSTPSSVGAQLSRRIAQGDAKELRQLADSLGVTPNVLMLGVFKVWLHRLSAQEHITVGTPIANREWTTIEGVIGFFMETAALSTRLSCRETLADAIAQVSQTTLEAFDHRDVPFQHIVDAVHTRAPNGRNPFFEVFFNHITMNVRSSSDGDPLGFTDTEIENATAKFDLTCYIFDDDEQIDIVFNYRKALFTETTIERFLDHYFRLLCVASDHLETPLSKLPILNPEERSTSAGVDESFPDSGLIHEFVKETVDAYPEHPAVIWDRGLLTYAQLWARSGSILSVMQESGIGVGDRVLVAAVSPSERSAATLAVLRLGGIFIPIDPHWPDKRIAQVARSISPAHALVDKSLADHFQSLAIEGHTIELDSITEQAPAEIEPRLAPSDPAYMLFTSGSTGEPKGVVQSHAGVVSHMHAFARSMEMTPQDRLLQVSSPAFDAAIMDMFSSWFTGAALCVCDLQHTDHYALASFIESNAISIYHSAPTVFRWLTTAIDDGYPLPAIRCVVLGGEPMVKSDADELKDHFPNCQQLINGLGLSESSLALQLRVHPDKLDEYIRWIPVGYPPEGSEIRLVDADGRLTELTGEIEIESRRIAIGYWNPELKSVDPIGEPIPGSSSRRFRTGDLGTMRSDGSIVHIGRLDHQVQIHGCRVEIDEVASAIKQLPGVTDAALLSTRTPTGDSELRGFVVLDPERQSSELELRDALSTLLPGYMIPPYWSRVEHIPRIGGGKLDRHALSVMPTLPFAHAQYSITDQGSAFVGQVCAAFEQVLGDRQITIHDSFFKFGGNSLKAIRVFSILKETTGTTLPISAIYQASTPGQLAQAIEIHASQQPNQHTELVLVPLSTAGDQPPVYLLPGVGGHPLGFGPMVERLSHQSPFIGIELPDARKIEELGRDLRTLASWMLDQMDLGDLDQAPDMIGYSFGGSLAIEMAIQLQERGCTPGHVILLDSHLPKGLPKKGKLGTLITHLGQIMRGGEEGRIEYIRSRLSGNQSKGHIVEPGDRVEEQEHHDYHQCMRINRKMLLNHSPSGVYHSRVCLVRTNQPEWLIFHHNDGYNGWSVAVDPEQIQIHLIDTTHLRVFKQGAVEQIAQIVDQSLADDRSSS